MEGTRRQAGKRKHKRRQPVAMSNEDDLGNRVVNPRDVSKAWPLRGVLRDDSE